MLLDSLAEKEKQLIVQEVNILKNLRHANIVKYYDRVVDRRASTLHIIMEYCPGGDLRRFVYYNCCIIIIMINILILFDV
jgi:serine/threonine protein kinase